MLIFAVMLVVLLVAFMTSIQSALFAMLAATLVALLIQWRWKAKDGAARSLKPLILIGGVVLAGLTTLLIKMYLFIDAELAPTREMTVKTKEIENIFEQHGDQRFTAAKFVVDGAKSDLAHRRLSETVLERFRNADYDSTPVSDSDLFSLESLLDDYSPSPAGKRACTLYHAHLYIRQTGLAGVQEVLSEYPTTPYCNGKAEYVRLLHSRCAATEESRAQCAALLPRELLLALRDASGDDIPIRYGLDTLLQDVYGKVD